MSGDVYFVGGSQVPPRPLAPPRRLSDRDGDQLLEGSLPEVKTISAVSRLRARAPWRSSSHRKRPLTSQKCAEKVRRTIFTKCVKKCVEKCVQKCAEKCVENCAKKCVKKRVEKCVESAPKSASKSALKSASKVRRKVRQKVRQKMR